MLFCLATKIVRNLEGLGISFFLSMISSCCLVTTCINQVVEYYSESWRTPPAFSLAPQYLQGSSWRAASFGTRSSGRLGWNGRWAWLGEEFFSKMSIHFGRFLGWFWVHIFGDVLSFSNVIQRLMFWCGCSIEVYCSYKSTPISLVALLRIELIPL